MLLRIGELAKAVGLSADTLRHYERLGLLANAGRTPGGFRQYTPQAVRRVHTIQAALQIGFSLQELAGLFRARAAGRPPCREARRLAGSKLDALDEELARLVQLRSELEKVIARWDDLLARSQPGTPALLLDSLADARMAARSRKTPKPKHHQVEERPCDDTHAGTSKTGYASVPLRRSPARAAPTKRPHTRAARSRHTLGR